MTDNNTDRDEQQKNEVWCGNPACHFCRHRNLVPAAFAAASSSLPAEPPTRSDLHAVICSVVFRHCKDVQLPHGIRGLEDDLTTALTKHFTSTDALDGAIKEAEDDLRITCPEMFGGKPISYKRGSE